MIPPAMDAVIVPDFTTEFPAVFEARALFFLASWLELFGEIGAGAINPHLACIGEPPESVRRLAARAGAGISVHAPVAGLWGGFANKLRGLEAPGSGERRLLLDADVLVLCGLEGLDEIGADFAAAAAGKPQVPLDLWRQIYATLELPLPTERMASVRGRLGLGVDSVFNPYEGQSDETVAMLPYYNSGVVLARRDRGLREQWEDHLRRIAAMAASDEMFAPFHAVIYGDQVALATSLQALRARGRTFEGLPDEFNARLVHFRAGAMQWEQVRLFHATGFLKGLRERADLPTAVKKYACRWAEAMAEGEVARGEARGSCEQPGRFLQRLWERWVQPEWETIRF